MTSDSASIARPSREAWGATFILLAFLLISLVAGTHTPTVYLDEPVFADPAANLYYGSGFTSTMWAQDRHMLWSCQPPLYAVYLFSFFKVAGFGLLQARMANAVLVAVGAWLIWLALRRTRLVVSPWARLLALSLVLSSSVSTPTFRVVRYDAGLFFDCALIFFTCCLPEKMRARWLWIILASSLVPLTGLPAVPFIGMVLLIHFAIYRWQKIRTLFSVGIGVILGGVALKTFYEHFGVWQEFVDFVHFVRGGPAEHSWKHILLGKSLGKESLLTSFFGNPTQFLDLKILFDYSAFMLFVLALWFTIKLWRTAKLDERRLMIFAIATALLVPPALHLTGHYWAYYRWMTYMPLALVLPRIIELARERGVNIWSQRAAWAVMAFSIFLGAPFRTLSALPDWNARSVKPLDEVVEHEVKPDDVVVCGFKSYFAVRARAKLVFCYGMSAKGEFGLIKDFPAKDVTLLCLSPADFAQVSPVVGGHWEKISLKEDAAAALERSRYATDFYRRVSN